MLRCGVDCGLEDCVLRCGVDCGLKDWADLQYQKVHVVL